MTFFRKQHAIPEDALRRFLGVLVAWTALVMSGDARGDFFDDIDYTKLQRSLGAQMPTGAGVSLSIVEAGGSSQIYFPDTSSSEFAADGDPFGAAVNFIDGSGKQANGTSGHATNQTRTIIGNIGGLAPGLNEVTIYETNVWLLNVLRYNVLAPPEAQDFQVQNHSWVGTLATGNPTPPPHTPSANNVKSLLRYDYLLETANNGAGMTAVVGLNNNTDPIPFLLSSSFNAIAVGRSDGTHSGGLTLDGSNSYGPYRSKPDIVAPRSSTSAATSTVSGVATLLYDALDVTSGANSEVVKSILLAGASKYDGDGSPKFPSWSRTTTQPLDDDYGAGELNAYNSFVIEAGGQQTGRRIHAAVSVDNYGWDYKNYKQDRFVEDVYYRFDVAAGMAADEFSAILSWNVEVEDNNPSDQVFDPVKSLQNLDLALFDSTGAFLGSLLDESVSTVDNVEHIYLFDDPNTSEFEGLAPGTYSLRVSGAANWDYGIAWRMSTHYYDVASGTYQFDVDFNDDGVVDGGDILIWQRNSGTMLGAANSQGDADGDGDVDHYDLAAVEAGFGTATFAAAVSAIHAVPEPTGAILIVLAMGLLGFGWLPYTKRFRSNR